MVRKINALKASLESQKQKQNLFPLLQPETFRFLHHLEILPLLGKLLSHQRQEQ